MDNSPKAVNVGVTSDDDTTAEVATKIRAALEEDADVGAFFTVSGADANIVLTAKTKAANDATMAMELTDADGTGVTVGASTDTQAGVAPVCQVETIATATGATQHGIVVVTVTAANMSGSPISVDVEVDANDSAVDVAGKIRTALGADETIGAFFTISGTGTANIILTCVDDAANDGTMAIAITDAPATSVTFGASANTTAGVPYDQISVGWGDKFGLPYKLYADELVILKLFNKAKESTEGNITADADDLAKNVYDPHDTTLGVDIDLYIIV
jgi:phage tail sheath gpL-like